MAPRLVPLILSVSLSLVSASAQTVVVRAGRLLDVRNQRALPDQAVVVAKGRVEEIRPFQDFQPPHGTQVIDLSDLTVLPGLIDAHTHLLTENHIRLGFGDPNVILTVAQMSTAKRALLGARVAREMLEAGITTVRDLGNSGLNGDVALRDAINAGWLPGPRMMVSTRALSPPGGQFGPLSPAAQSLVKQEYVEVTGIDEARRAVRHALYDGADCIKIIAGDRGRSLSIEEMEAIVEEAHRLDRAGFPKRPVAADAVDDFAIRRAVEVGVDSIEHGKVLSDETLQLMAEKGTFLVPNEESEADPLIPEVAKAGGRRQARRGSLYISRVRGTGSRVRRAHGGAVLSRRWLGRAQAGHLRV